MEKLENNFNTYIKAQLAYLKSKKSTDKKSVQPFITVSRETGAYGLTISKGIADYLNKKNKSAYCPWTVFNRKSIKSITEAQNLTETLQPYIKTDEVEDIMKQTFNPNLPQHSYIQSSTKNILHLAQLGNAVIIGCAANVFTSKLPGGFHIRLVGSFLNRLDHIQEFYPMSEKEAKVFIFSEEGLRRDYVKKYFGQDIDDPALYNMIINIDELKPQEIIQIVGDIIIKKYQLK